MFYVYSSALNFQVLFNEKQRIRGICHYDQTIIHEILFEFAENIKNY